MPIHVSRLMAAASLLLLPALAAAQSPPVRQVVGTPTSTLSPGIRHGDVLYTSGQLGMRAGGDTTIQGQTRQTLENVKTIVEQGGSKMEHVVKCTVFLVDARDFSGMNQVYREFFPKEPPARSTVVVAALVVPNAKVEIECIAAMPR